MDRRDKNKLLDTLDVVYELGKHLLTGIYELGGGDDDLRGLLSDNETSGLIVYLIMRKHLLRRGFPILLAGRLSQSCKYFVNSFDQFITRDDSEATVRTIEKEICDNRCNEPQVKRLHVLHLNRKIGKDKLINEMRRRKVRPATPLEQIIFALKYPLEQGFYPICVPLYPYEERMEEGLLCNLLYNDCGKRVFSSLITASFDKEVRFLVNKDI